jgi:hypothetical protein
MSSIFLEIASEECKRDKPDIGEICNFLKKMMILFRIMSSKISSKSAKTLKNRE